MAISLLELRKRYVIASKAVEDYSLKISSKLSTGNTDKTLLRKFNLMSAWISFLEPKIPEIINIQGASPTSIILPIPELNIVDEGKEEITIGIEDYKGEFVPILSFFHGTFSGDFGARAIIGDDPKAIFAAEVRSYLNDMKNEAGERKDLAFKKGINITVKTSTNDVVVSFPATSDFNHQKIIPSPNIINQSEFTRLIVKGGVTEKISGKNLSQDLINSYNKLLEEIAIELKISYADDNNITTTY